MLTPDELKELQGIVGPKWVAAEPCERDAYAIWYNSSSLNKEGKLWTSRPAAIVMPKDTGEVSEITRFCNRKDFMIKPFSTGWITACAPGSRKTIMIDLKRMDRIIDIDVKNQIAVVEPYVRAIDLQTELWKRGLNVHTVSIFFFRTFCLHRIPASYACIVCPQLVAHQWLKRLTPSVQTKDSNRDLLSFVWLSPLCENKLKIIEK